MGRTAGRGAHTTMKTIQIGIADARIQDNSASVTAYGKGDPCRYAPPAWELLVKLFVLLRFQPFWSSSGLELPESLSKLSWAEEVLRASAQKLIKPGDTQPRSKTVGKPCTCSCIRICTYTYTYTCIHICIYIYVYILFMRSLSKSCVNRDTTMQRCRASTSL